jgi:hypothetical protein
MSDTQAIREIKPRTNIVLNILIFTPPSCPKYVNKMPSKRRKDTL